MSDDNEHRASKCREGVEVSPKHGGCLGDEQIAHNASANTGQHAQQCRHQRVQSVRKRLLCAGDGKERKTCRIEDQYCGAQAHEQ